MPDSPPLSDHSDAVARALEAISATRPPAKEGTRQRFRRYAEAAVNGSGLLAELDVLRAENEQLRKAVTVWLESPQPEYNRLNGIRGVLGDPEYRAKMAVAFDDIRDTPEEGTDGQA